MSAGVCHVPSIPQNFVANFEPPDFGSSMDLPISTICVILCHVYGSGTATDWHQAGVLNTEMGMGRTGPNDQLCTMAGSVVQYTN